MEMSQSRKMWWLILVLIGLIVSPTSALGESEGSGFNVTPVNAPTQIDPSVSYFYLETKPKKKQTIQVEIASTQKESQEIMIEVQDAYTQKNGTVGYGLKGQDFEEDVTREHALTEVLKPIESSVTIEGFKTKKVSLELTPPETPYAGIKMGQIEFSQKEEDSNQVANKMSYQIGVITSENGDVFSDSKSFNLLDVVPSVVDGEKAVKVIFQNAEPKLIENLEIDAVMHEEGAPDKVLRHKKVAGYTMAPNSTVDYLLGWGLAELPTGKFTLSVKAKSDYETWELSQNFVITDKQARELSKQSAFSIETPLWVKIFAVINGIAVVAIAVVLLTRRKGMEAELKVLQEKGKRKKSRNKPKKESKN